MITWFNNPHNMRQLHLWLAIAWAAPATAGAWVIVYMVPEPHAAFAILMVSNYANFVGHWAAWQAVRAEEAQTPS